jgi:hypothetical protein
MARAKSSGGSSTTLVVVVAAVGILVVGGGVYLLWGGGEEEPAQPQMSRPLQPPQATAEPPAAPERTARTSRGGAGEITRPQQSTPQRPAQRDEPKKNEKQFPKRDPGGPPTGLGPV